MKYLKLFLTVMLFQQIVGCTVSHDFGPYQGKVVDRDTLEPIEGAVIFIEFIVRASSLGGESGYFGDAVETLTDKNGEFYIPTKRLSFTRRSLSEIGDRWDEHGYIIIFKPGYGAFPKHPNSEPRDNPFYQKPPQQSVMIQLPKLHSIEERKRNMHFSTGLGVPNDKKMNLLRLECIERKRIGLEPTVNCCEDEK